MNAKNARPPVSTGGDIEPAKEVGKSRRGFPKYTANPSVQTALANTQTGTKRISNKTGDQFMIVSEQTGEVLAPAGFHSIVEIDKTQFVKLYIDGVRAFQGLTSAGTKVFEMMYRLVQEHPGTDHIYIHPVTAHELHMDISERTFHRGLKELLQKGFLYESQIPGKYWLNISYVFNGNRLAFVREYRIRPDSKSKPLVNEGDQTQREELEARGQQRLAT